jgi:hypothetical protein
MKSGSQSLFAPIIIVGGLVLAVWVVVDVARGGGQTTSANTPESPADMWRPSYGTNTSDPRQVMEHFKDPKKRRQIIEHPHRSDLSSFSVEKLEQMFNDPSSSPNLKREVIWELGKQERKSQMGDEFLRKVLNESTDFKMRMNVLDTLMQRKDAFSRELLEHAIKDSNEEVRTAAYIVLAFQPDDGGSISDLFLKRFQEEEAVGGKRAVLIALALQRMDSKKENEKAKELIVTSMKDDAMSMELRRASVASLEPFATDNDVPMLEQLKLVFDQKEETRELVDLVRWLILTIKTRGKDPIKVN